MHNNFDVLIKSDPPKEHCQIPIFKHLMTYTYMLSFSVIY